MPWVSPISCNCSATFSTLYSLPRESTTVRRTWKSRTGRLVTWMGHPLATTSMYVRPLKQRQGRCPASSLTPPGPFTCV